MIGLLLALLAALLGCGEGGEVEVEVTPTGLAVRAEAGVERVRVLDPEGTPLLTRRAAAPVESLALEMLWEEAGTYRVEVRTAEGEESLPVEVPAASPPLLVEVEAPLGQGLRDASPDAVLPFRLVEGQPARIAVTLEALRAGEALIRLGEHEERGGLRPGERLRLRAELSEAVEVDVALGERQWSFTLAPQRLSLEEAREQLALTEVRFPAHRDGRPDLTRPRGRVTLPSAWWQATLDALGLGLRPTDGWTPWSWVGVELENRGAEDLSVVIAAKIVDEDGAPETAFRPRLREGDDGSGVVRALLRVPAGETATGALPLFVDGEALSADRAAEEGWRMELRVLPLGGAEALVERTEPLFVSRGSTAASLGLGVALLAALGGTILLLRRGPRWLAGARTSALMTIALFGALSFVVHAAARLLGLGVSALLGPFAPLLTGLVDDVLRYTLLATLITLLPRPGTAALAALTAWLLSGIALGTFTPTDILFVGGQVLWLEGALWAFGLTRGRGWLEQRAGARWLRLSLAFGLASVATNATGLVLHVVLYRLFLADWYVALMLAGPGFLYVALACGLAVPFADSLRRVQR